MTFGWNLELGLGLGIVIGDWDGGGIWDCELGLGIGCDFWL